MIGRTSVVTVLMVAAFALTATAGAQGAAATPEPPWIAPSVGSMAPDFELVGATRYGVLGKPVRLSDYRGETVVIAFFYKARTKG